MNELKMTTDKLQEYKQEMGAAVTIVEHLKRYCTTIDELETMMNLAAENEGQLRLVMTSVVSATKR